MTWLLIELWLRTTPSIPDAGKDMQPLFRCQENIAKNAKKVHQSAKLSVCKVEKRADIAEKARFGRQSANECIVE